MFTVTLTLIEKESRLHPYTFVRMEYRLAGFLFFIREKALPQ